MNVLPLFKSHYSIGKSILTFDEPKRKKFGPTSILTIAKENNLEVLPIVEDSISGFIELQKNAASLKTKIVFGVNLFLTHNMLDKTDESAKQTSKITVFFKNERGYFNLIEILSKAACDGNFKGTPRIDSQALAKLWNEKNLSLTIPFYDSFLFNNVLKGYQCVPNLSFTKPTFFIENNSLPFDDILKQKVEEYCKIYSCPIIQAQSIYYEKKEDFTAYLAFRCIHNRSTLDKPELNHLCSDEFCFESWFTKNYVRQSVTKQ